MLLKYLLTVTLAAGMIKVSTVEPVAEPLASENPECRVTCTVQVPDGLGGSVGVSATAGNIFTSCETAGDLACKKAARKALNALSDAIR